MQTGRMRDCAVLSDDAKKRSEAERRHCSRGERIGVFYLGDNDR